MHHSVHRAVVTYNTRSHPTVIVRGVVLLVRSDAPPLLEDHFDDLISILHDKHNGIDNIRLLLYQKTPIFYVRFKIIVLKLLHFCFVLLELHLLENSIK